MFVVKHGYTPTMTVTSNLTTTIVVTVQCSSSSYMHYEPMCVKENLVMMTDVENNMNLYVLMVEKFDIL